MEPQITGSASRVVTVGSRAIGYRVFGDISSSRTVISAHGGLVSAGDASAYDEIARDRGIRIVSPDRPGVGMSDRDPQRSILSWGHEDVGAVLDDIGATDAVALGWSAGGQYALAAAVAQADRIRGVVVIAGALPLDDADNLRELNRMDRRLITLSRRLPATARSYFHVMRRMLRRRPEQVERLSEKSLGPADAAIIRARSEWYTACMLEAVTQINGAVDEYRVFGAPWGFTPAEVSAPVTIIQGDADQLIRPVWSSRMVSALPSATLVNFPEAGHFVGLAHPDAVMTALDEHLG